MPPERCRYCDAPLDGAELGLLRLEDEEIESQVTRRGLVVCPACDRVLGGLSEHHRSDLEQLDAATWERMRSYNDI